MQKILINISAAFVLKSHGMYFGPASSTVTFDKTRRDEIVGTCPQSLNLAEEV